MRYRNILSSIHSALAHVYYEVPEVVSFWPEDVAMNDLDVHCFAQTWGDTSCGFGGMAGQSITTCDVVVVQEMVRCCAVVYINGKSAYAIRRPNKKFYEDLSRKRMIGWSDYARQYEHEE